jgi:nicotinamide-nucleotide amidase
MAARAGARVIRSRTVRTVGIPESTLAERLGDVENAVAPLTVAYLPGLSGVDVRITAWNVEAAEADQRLDEAVDVVRARAGEGVYGEDDADLAALVVEAARQRNCTLAVAESCTGGMLGGALTRVPGASAVFTGGIIAYDNTVKADQLGVPLGTLEQFGAVSAETAAAMAEGARERLGADLAISITGVAGPDGGTAEKPVGLVWFGLADAAGTGTERRLLFGGREAIRARARDTALDLLRTTLARRA